MMLGMEQQVEKIEKDYDTAKIKAGAGGVAGAGEAFLALAGPIGWAIAGFSILDSVFSIFNAKIDKEKLEDNSFVL